MQHRSLARTLYGRVGWRGKGRESENKFLTVQSNRPVFALYDRIEYKGYAIGREGGESERERGGGGQSV